MIIHRSGIYLLFIPINGPTTPSWGGTEKDKIMQKPNTVFAKKPTAPVAHAAKTEHASDPKPAPAAHADRHDADKNAKHAQKK